MGLHGSICQSIIKDTLPLREFGMIPAIVPMTSIARLLVAHGPQKGAVFALKGGETQIGRESSNDIEVRDLSVSRRHCTILRRGPDFVLLSLESTNGTRVNGIPMTER